MDQSRRSFATRIVTAAAGGGLAMAQAAEPQTRRIPPVVKTYVDTFAAGGLTTGGLDVWFSILTADSTYSDPDFPTPVPALSLKEHWKEAFSAFPDAKFELVSLDALSERAWVYRWIMQATHTGPINGIPATGRRVQMPGCDFIELRGDLISSDVGYFDRFTQWRQLGFTLNKPPAPST